MDFGDIIYYVLAAVFFLYSAWSKSQKKKNHSGENRPNEDGEPSTFETILQELTGEQSKEPEKPVVEAPAELSKEYKQEVIKSLQKTSVKKPNYKEEAHKPTKILQEELEINDEEQTIDMRQAVIHSVILNRPEY